MTQVRYNSYKLIDRADRIRGFCLSAGEKVQEGRLVCIGVKGLKERGYQCKHST